MGLPPFAKLGPYEVIGPLGAGGMGEVYRARDTRLARNVAIKVLPAEFAANSDRMRRFELEARAAGMLNHPNILSVYDAGTHEGVPYLVTELLEGETLRAAGLLPRRTVLNYAQQIARGLAAAHDKGITHRDLKPENIFITRDEQVKILDFGLAKLSDREPAMTTDAPTSPVTTHPGMVMGTAGYMSPEQVRGQTVDHRSDIFSVGVVLYEMLSGKRAFTGDSNVEAMHAILTSDPPELPDAALDRIVRRCLEKRPERRFQSASDLAFAIGQQSETPSGGVIVQQGRSRSAVAWYTAVAIALAAGVASGIAWQARRAPTAAVWNAQQLPGPNIALHPRLSPDGRTLAFVALIGGQRQLAIAQPGSLNWTVLTHERGRGGIFDLCWSRDGSKIYFDRGDSLPRGIYSIPALGGEERLILEDAVMPEVLPDGSLFVLRVEPDGSFRLHRLWPETGRIEALPAYVFNEVRLAPSGKKAIFYGNPSKPQPPMGFHELDIETGRTRPLVSDLKLGIEDLAPSGYGLVSLAIENARSFLTVMRSEDAFRVIRVTPDSGIVETLFSLPVRPTTIDIAADGSIFLDQLDLPREVLRFSVSGGIPEHLMTSRGLYDAIPMPDGRILLGVQISGRRRLLAARPGTDPSPFIDTEEETSLPATPLGDREVAFLAGTGADRTVEVASVATGRVNRRLTSTKGVDLNWLSASPDGQTLYYVLFRLGHGSVWSVPSNDGTPRKLTDAAVGIASPREPELLLERWDKSTVTLSKLPLAGGAESAIQVRSSEGLLLGDVLPGAVGKDGQILTTLFSKDRAFVSLGIVDPRTGTMTRIPVTYEGNIIGRWAPDGRIIAVGEALHAAIWRYHRETK